MMQTRAKTQFKADSFRASGFGDKALDVVIFALVALAVLVTAYPFLYVVSVSISDGAAVARGDVLLFPKGFSLDAFSMVLKYDQLWVSYGNTFIYTFFGTIANMVFTCLAAYPLSKRHFFLRRKLNFFVVFTMYFSGGLIPTYMVVTGIGLYNSRLAMILPVLLSTYNMMICRSAMEAVPQDLYENASLEGASEFYQLLHIAIPLVKPTLAVLTLYYAVAHWNSYFDAFLYLTNRKLYPLQIVLREILIANSINANEVVDDLTMSAKQGMADLLKFSLIIVSSLPVLVLYPFVKKYFLKGVMIGALKG